MYISDQLFQFFFRFIVCIFEIQWMCQLLILIKSFPLIFTARSILITLIAEVMILSMICFRIFFTICYSSEQFATFKFTKIMFIFIKSLKNGSTQTMGFVFSKSPLIFNQNTYARVFLNYQIATYMLAYLYFTMTVCVLILYFAKIIVSYPIDFNI